MKFTRVLFYMAGFLAWGMINTGSGFAAKENPVVVELFTSQGCSSCPPAEAVLSSMQADTQDVIFLAFHVTYWNYIGWQDPFGDAAFTNRQRLYTHTKNEPNLFTPQFRVNGGLGFSDHQGKKLTQAVQNASSTPPTVLCDIFEVAVAEKHIQALITIKTSVFANPEYKKGRIYVVLTEDGLTTDVKAGENKGRTLKSDAVVRWFEPIGKWKKNADWKKRITLPRDPAWNIKNMRIVVFAQEQDKFVIVGATTKALKQ